MLTRQKAWWANTPPSLDQGNTPKNIMIPMDCQAASLFDQPAHSLNDRQRIGPLQPFFISNQSHWASSRPSPIAVFTPPTAIEFKRPLW
jgi:hypothetical protein